MSAGFSQISDAIKAGRFLESLSFLGGIRNTGVNISYTLLLDDVIRNFEVTLSKPNLSNFTVGVNINIFAIENGLATDAISQTFSLDYFNFPLINNTRLSKNHRFALVITGFD